MSGVACTLRARIGPGSRSTVLSGGDRHVLVLENLNQGWHMQDLVFYICHEVRDPQLGIIGLNRRCSSVTESRSHVLHRS
jgi:hypothetical protein